MVVQVVKADLRQPITAWKALVWAYAQEHVRVATNNDMSWVKTGPSSVDLEGGHGAGAINGYLEAHDDALAIDKKAREWFNVDRHYYPAFASAVEKRRRPAKGCELKPLRAVKVLRLNGTIKCEYRKLGRHDEPWYCLVEYEGHDWEEMRCAQELHDLFIAFLDIMPGLKLSKWLVSERGIDSSGRIIDKGPFNRQK